MAVVGEEANTDGADHGGDGGTGATNWGRGTTSVYYASGGAGAGSTVGEASIGGGADGRINGNSPSGQYYGRDGIANTGGGGGGGGSDSTATYGGQGGGGIVMIRYQVA